MTLSAMKNIINGFLILAVILIAFPAAQAQKVFHGKPLYQIEVRRADTVMGKIIVEMFPAIAPNHVHNWDSLVSIHFFDSTAFHRVIPGFMIQGGDPNTRSGSKDTWGTGDSTQATVNAEFNAVSHRRGILSAARTSDPNSATSQFFICIANPTYLDRQYTVYGRVISGMSVADAIVKSKRDASDDPLVKISMFITPSGNNDSLTMTPKLVLPLDGAINVDRVTAKLRWNKISDAMMYRLQIATDTSFTTILFDSTLSQADTSMAFTKLGGASKFYWRVLASNGGDISQYSLPWSFSLDPLAVIGTIAPELECVVYPNPTISESTIRFSLEDPSVVSLSIYDILGNKIISLIDSKLFTQGLHSITVNINDLTSGTYFCRLETDKKMTTKKLIVK